MSAILLSHMSREEFASFLASVAENTPVSLAMDVSAGHPGVVTSVAAYAEGFPTLAYCTVFTGHPDQLPPINDAYMHHTIHRLNASLRAGFNFKSVKDPFVAGDMMQYSISPKDPFTSLCRDLLPAEYAAAVEMLKPIDCPDNIRALAIESLCVRKVYQKIEESLLEGRSAREQELVKGNLEAQAATNLLLAKGSYKGFVVSRPQMQAAADKMAVENEALDKEVVGIIRGHLGWPDPQAKPENSLF